MVGTHADSSGDVQPKRPPICLTLELSLVSPLLCPLVQLEAVSEAAARRSERVLGHIYPQSNHRAASEVDDGVDRDHFQVQLYVPGPFDGASHHQGGTDGARLPHIEFSALIPRLDLENVISPRVAGCCLHLEDVSGNRAS